MEILLVLALVGELVVTFILALKVSALQNKIEVMRYCREAFDKATQSDLNKVAEDKQTKLSEEKRKVGRPRKTNT